ncbi:MAG: hypothetical protein U5R31_00795 [Acidimicrobiia bacterium]|nr:hypothetical protein [Acidimicrobiia bacterium]
MATSEDWEGPLAEGPRIDGPPRRHVLALLLGQLVGQRRLRRGGGAVAASCSRTGPCTKHEGPWLASHGDASGPGGAEAFTDQFGGDWLVYHAWVTDTVGYDEGGARSLFAVPLGFEDGEPVPEGVGS